MVRWFLVLMLVGCLAGPVMACGGSAMGGSFAMQSTRMVPIDPSLDLAAGRWSSPAGLRIVQRSDGSLVANSGSRRQQITNRVLPLSAKGGLMRGHVRTRFTAAPRAMRTVTRRVQVAGICPT